MGAWLKYAAGAVFGFETVMIFAGRKNTISYMCGRRPVLIPVVVGGLVVHLYHSYLCNRSLS